MPRQLQRFMAILCLPCAVSTTIRATAVSRIPDEFGAGGVVDSSVSSKVAAATSQPSNGVSWDMLRSMRAGVKLRLSLADGSEIVGQLVAAKADTLVLNRNKVRKGPFTARLGHRSGIHSRFCVPMCCR
jgi:hypothetical protein